MAAMTASPSNPLTLTRAAARALDRAAVETFRIPSILLMEHAALALFDHSRELIAAQALPSVLILCGPGANGGDGYALARLLATLPIPTTIAALAPPAPNTDAATYAAIASALGIPTVPLTIAALAPLLKHPTLIIDALFGTGLDRPLAPSFEPIFEQLHRAAHPILAVDLPSGLESETGNPLGPCIRATRTVTFIAPKPAMTNPTATPFLGTVVVAKIATPPTLLTEFGRPAPQ